MKTKLRFAAAVVGLFVLSNVGFAQGNSGADRYVVQLKPDVDPVDVLVDYAIATPKIYRHVLNGFAAQIPPGRLVALAKDARVAVIAPDRMVYAFASRGGGKGGTSVQTTPAGVGRIDAKNAWDRSPKIDGAGIGVAIVDTGLDFNHQDLPVAPDDWFVSPGFTYTSTAQDDAGHGTHVGGIVAALNNSQDVVGVAPGATLYAVKVLDNTGSGYDSDVILGLEWVKKNAGVVQPNIKVVNMSLGGPASVDPKDDEPFQTAIANLVNVSGITVVVAAGNDRNADVSQMVPAKFPEVIAVASSTAKTGSAKRGIVPIPADTASFFTTDGPGIAISAPGEDQEDISGIFIKPVGILSTALGGGTTRMYGTSMASPHVAGAVALLLQKESGLTPAAVKDRVKSTAAGAGTLPYDSAIGGDDGIKEGILYVPSLLGP